ncbi:C2 calcium-dependent membrane targeting [Macleaya cordata]|uniref:C2 calcium-dependent membrane targeting n=1 Tax=Macleaya cordata TaxID=56857 RepID=A0A200PVL7_MACCD|nr:C2 calcium-dependent membrane targeting [Macleaya cordata]
MGALRNHQNPFPLLHCLCSPSPKLLHLPNPNFLVPTNNKLFLKEVAEKVRVLRSRYNIKDGNYSFCCYCKQNSNKELEFVEEKEDQIERPPFDINLAVVLAGFAFEAYSSPPDNVGRREVDAAGCQTVFLSELFLREAYDGQLFVKLKKGVNFPAMDPWGTSDPYVVMQLDGQVVKSKVKWATKDPTWNEDFTLNIKIPPTKNLQVAAWDANLVTPHKRMGNTGISLESLCDGHLHEVLLELGGMGGGGKIHLEFKYKSFDEVDEEKQWWRIPFISDLLAKNNLGSALEKVLGTDTVQARQFVEYAFGQLRSFDFSSQKIQFLKDDINDMESSGKSINSVGSSDMPLQQENGSLDGSSYKEDGNFLGKQTDNDAKGDKTIPETRVAESVQPDKYFWNNFADVLNHTVIQKLGISPPDQIRWDGFDLLNKIGLQSKSIAEAEYVQSGLATPESQAADDNKSEQSSTDKVVQSSVPDIKKVSWDVLRQTDSILGAIVVLTTTFSQQKKETPFGGESDAKNGASTALVDDVPGYSSSETILSPLDESSLGQGKSEEMKALFSTAESAMEAWAMLATSLGQPSFIKSEFEKICFLDNTSTDTQVAVWRDSPRKRLVIAFRGTEQTRWKDLRTDLMLVPAGLNPERIGGNFKQEVQVHSGFLSAYDSVRNKLISIIKLSIGFIDDSVEVVPKWHIYVTGHSLGGALATLLALELSSSNMAKHGAISVTMYNFGSPRVGNRRFVEVYNEKVKDSWRIVNHRDIIPTVPRLMGYCHVAQPIYLASGDLSDAFANMELLADGYHGDVIAEYTPDVLVSEFMKGEKQLIEKILQTEINIFRSIRDGSALMQHMEDFYYITLLENVRSNCRTVGSSNSNEEGSLPSN